MEVISYTTNPTVCFRKRALRESAEPMGRAIRLMIDGELPDPMIGFGAALTGSSTALLNRMDPVQRKKLLRDLYTDQGLNLSVGRVSVGSSDYSPELYTYDEVAGDTALEHFSVEPDEEFVLPMLREVLKIKPELFLFSSPWSPPGWMKTGGSMCGGYMRREYLEVYADYYVRFLEEYRKRGIEIRALTPQNECETHQSEKSVACIWHPEYEAEFVLMLRKKLEAAHLNPQIWLYDHNFDGANRVLWMLETYPELLKASGAVAWHYYGGSVQEITEITRRFPEVKMHFSEGGPRLYDHYDTDWCKWGIMMTSAIRCGCRSFTGGNLLLDETGGPNVGPFDCGGLVTLNSQTGELSYSGQYRAMRHFSGLIQSGATVLKTETRGDDTDCMASYPNLSKPVSACAFRNPDGTTVVQLTNPNETRRQMQTTFGGKKWYFELLGQSITSVVFAGE